MLDGQKLFWRPQEGQRIAFEIPLQVKEILLHGNRGSGKGLHVQCQVLSDSGWKPAGQVIKTDRLVAPDGTYTNIEGIWNRETGPLYQITFSDGCAVTVDDVHRWSVSTDLIQWQTLNTQQLISNPRQWSVPVAKSPQGVEFIHSSAVRQIVSIQRVKDGPSVCFAVDHPSHQYVIENEIVTHNTDCLLVSFLRGVGRGWGPAWRGICFKRTVPEIGPLFEKAKAIYQANCPNIKYTQHPYAKFVWPTGEMLTLRHMLEPDDYNDLHGSEFQWIGWEEITTHATPEVYLRCMSLLRSSHPEASKWMQVWSTTNPGGPGHFWCKKRWQLPAMNNKIIYDSSDREELSRWSKDPLVNVQSRPRVAVFLDVRRNEIFLKANPTYLADLVSQAPNEATRRAWIDGDWDVIAGGVWDDVWDQRYHVLHRFPIPKSWRIDRSLDWGSSTPFCVLWYAESDGCDFKDAEGYWRSSLPGDIFVIHEWYGTTDNKPNEGLKLTVGEVAKGIIEREIEWGIYERCFPGPADNQIHQELQAGQNLAADFLTPVRLDDGREFPGVSWERSDKGDGSRKTGCDMIRERLRRAVPDSKSPVLREQPALFFVSDLKYTLQQFPNTPRDEKDVDTYPKRGEFHIQDTLRYRILADGRGVTSGPTVGKY